MADNNYDHLYDCKVVDQDHNKIGNVGQVYLDDETGLPTWITVKTGLFGTKEPFAPLEQAVITEDTIQVPYAESFVREAPRVDPDGHLDAGEEYELYNYYGIAAVPAAEAAGPAVVEPADVEPEVHTSVHPSTITETEADADPTNLDSHAQRGAVDHLDTPSPAVSPETDVDFVATDAAEQHDVAAEVSPVETEAPAATPIPGDKNGDGKLSFGERVSQKWDEMNQRGKVEPANEVDPYDHVIDDPQR